MPNLLFVNNKETEARNGSNQAFIKLVNPYLKMLRLQANNRVFQEVWTGLEVRSLMTLNCQQLHDIVKYIVELNARFYNYYH